MACNPDSGGGRSRTFLPASVSVAGASRRLVTDTGSADATVAACFSALTDFAASASHFQWWQVEDPIRVSRPGILCCGAPYGAKLRYFDRGTDVSRLSCLTRLGRSGKKQHGEHCQQGKTDHREGNVRTRHDRTLLKEDKHADYALGCNKAYLYF